MLKLPISTESLRYNEPVPFRPQVDRELLDITKQKLALARYPEEQTDFGEHDWTQGAKVSSVRELADYWLEKYDWEKQEVSLEQIRHTSAHTAHVRRTTKLLPTRSLRDAE
jgi:hypothetical protein